MSLLKTRPKDRPYEVWSDGSWQWDVLKFYKSRENTMKDQYGRVFCNVHGFETEMGDVYYSDITSRAVLVSTDYED